MADLARRVRDSAIREELVAALNYCAALDSAGGAAEGRRPGRGARLVEGPARAASGRGGRYRKSATQLKARLAGVDPSQLTPALLARLGRILSDEEGLDLLLRHSSGAGRLLAQLHPGQRPRSRGPRRGDRLPLRAGRSAAPGVVHNNLGVAFGRRAGWRRRLACHREAARSTRTTRGCLSATGTLPAGPVPAEAIAVPGHPAPQPGSRRGQCHLAWALRKTGRFADALEHFRRGHELGSKYPGWNRPSADWVRDCQRLSNSTAGCRP